MGIEDPRQVAYVGPLGVTRVAPRVQPEPTEFSDSYINRDVPGETAEQRSQRIGEERVYRFQRRRQLQGLTSILDQDK
jgi:hypothetical protein